MMLQNYSDDESQVSADNSKNRTSEIIDQNDLDELKLEATLIAANDKAAAQAETRATAAVSPKEEEKPIRIKDALDREFSIPFHLVRTWAVGSPYL